jgi:hypothetical protein
MVMIGILSKTGSPLGVMVCATSSFWLLCTSKRMILGVCVLDSMLALASRKSLVKYSVLIRKVPMPMAKMSTAVWLLGLNRFSKLCRAEKLHDLGK